jgi:hypothetical protein
VSGRRQRFRNPDDPIERRIIDALVHLVHVRKWQPRAIYLAEEDMAKLPRKYQHDQINGLPVRVGARSALYADCGYRVLI